MPAGWHNAVTLDSTGRFIAAESGDTGKIGLFSQRKDEWLPFAEFDTGAVSWISLSPDGGRLAVAGWDGLNVWSTTTRSNLFSSKTSAYWVDFSPDGRWLVVGRERYEILKTSDWATITTLDSRTVGPHQCRAAFTPDGRWLATGHPFGKIALWKAPAWDRVGVLESPSGNPVGRFTFDAAGDNLYNATTGGVIESWDLKLLATELQALGLGW